MPVALAAALVVIAGSHWGLHIAPYGAEGRRPEAASETTTHLPDPEHPHTTAETPVAPWGQRWSVRQDPKWIRRQAVVVVHLKQLGRYRIPGRGEVGPLLSEVRSRPTSRNSLTPGREARRS